MMRMQNMNVKNIGIKVDLKMEGKMGRECLSINLKILR